MMKSVSFSEVYEVCLSHFGPIFALMFVQKRIINVQKDADHSNWDKLICTVAQEWV